MITNLKNWKLYKESILILEDKEIELSDKEIESLRLLQQEEIHGDLPIDSSFLILADIDPTLFKLKKVNGSIFLKDGVWNEIPVWLKDVEVGVFFMCQQNKLTSLKNCPQKIGSSFICKDNRLETLEGCPKIVRRNFDCSGNRLISLEHGPEQVGRDYTCTNNQLTSLDGIAKYIGGSAQCYLNRTLKMPLPEGVEIKGFFRN